MSFSRISNVNNCGKRAWTVLNASNLLVSGTACPQVHPWQARAPPSSSACIGVALSTKPNVSSSRGSQIWKLLLVQSWSLGFNLIWYFEHLRTIILYDVVLCQGNLKMGDFGIAKVLSSTQARSTHTAWSSMDTRPQWCVLSWMSLAP